MSGHMFSVDGLLIYRQAAALALDHSIHFPDALHWGSYVTTNSKYGIGLSLIYVPGIALLHWLTGLQPINGDGFALLYDDRLYRIAIAPIHATIAALTALVVASLARRLGLNRLGTLWAVAFFGLGSPAIIYARGDTSQALTALCWISAIFFALRYRDGARFRDLLVAGVAVAYGILTRPVEGALAIPFVLICILPTINWRGWDWTSWIALGGIVASSSLGVFLSLLVSWLRFGSPLLTGYEGEGWTTPVLVGLAGTLVSPARGLLWEFPAILLAPLGFRHLWGGRERAVAVTLAGLPSLQLLNTAAWSTWWGGANWGLRLFVPAIPLVAVVAGAAVGELSRFARTWVPLVVVAVGLVFAVPAVAVDLFSGSLATANGSAESFRIQAYPPFGAWSGLHHVRGISLDDKQSVDVLWFRLAGKNRLWLGAPLALAAAAALLAGHAALPASARPYSGTRGLTHGSISDSSPAATGNASRQSSGPHSRRL